jgi:basic membrane lipoprotein Med (substrate-binding protein (PBP1-ABC) superfamily)
MIAVAATGLWAGCFDAPQTATLEVGLVGEGDLDDNTYNRLIYDGCLRAAADFGAAFDFTISTPAAFEEDIGNFGARGYDHVLTVSFFMAPATRAAAAAYPDTTFAILDFQYDEADLLPNLAGYVFREDQGAFLGGVVAGLVAQENNDAVGCIGGIPIPAIKRFCNGFGQGVRRICPDCPVFIAYSASFSDPDEGIAKANELIGQGATIIFGAGGLTGSAGIAHAAEQGVSVIGVDQDEFFTTFRNGDAPGARYLLTSVLKRVDVAAYESIRGRRLGTFTSGSVTLGIAEDGMGLAPYHLAADQITAEMQQQIDVIYAGLREGSIDTGVDPLTGELAGGGSR